MRGSGMPPVGLPTVTPHDKEEGERDGGASVDGGEAAHVTVWEGAAGVGEPAEVARSRGHLGGGGRRPPWLPSGWGRPPWLRVKVEEGVRRTWGRKRPPWGR